MTLFAIDLQHHPWALFWLSLAAAGSLAQAQVSLTCDKCSVQSWETCKVTASHADGRPRRWEWSLGEGDRGSFTEIRHTASNVFRAPEVEAPVLVRIRVRDLDAGGEAWTECPLQVRPAQVRVICRQPPALNPIGRLPADGDVIRSLNRVEEIPGVQPGAWLAINGTGRIFRMGENGADGAWLPLQGRLGLDPAAPAGILRHCGALAARPPGPDAPGNPRRIVAAVSCGQGQYLCEMDLNGDLRPIAGTGRSPENLCLDEADGAEFTFNRITALAIDRFGHVLVAEKDRLLRVTPDGTVSLVPACPVGESGFPANGPETETFHSISGLALDPDRGDLYLLDGHALRKLGRDGRLATLVGHPQRPSADPRFEPMAWGEPVAPQLNYLSNPKGLWFHRGIVFLVDTALRAYRPASNRLYTILPGVPAVRDQAWPPSGTLRVFQRDGLLGECASPMEVTCFAAAGGRALVGVDGHAAELDLDRLGLFEPAAAPPEPSGPAVDLTAMAGPPGEDKPLLAFPLPCANVDRIWSGLKALSRERVLPASGPGGWDLHLLNPADQAFSCLRWPIPPNLWEGLSEKMDFNSGLPEADIEVRPVPCRPGALMFGVAQIRAEGWDDSADLSTVLLECFFQSATGEIVPAPNTVIRHVPGKPEALAAPTPIVWVGVVPEGAAQALLTIGNGSRSPGNRVRFQGVRFGELDVLNLPSP